MNGDLPIKPVTPPPPPPEDVPPPAEDAGSRALDDALRSSFLIVNSSWPAWSSSFSPPAFSPWTPQHKAILLRFGKPVGEGANALLGPGAHWAFPAPIDEKEFIPSPPSDRRLDNRLVSIPEDRAKGVEPPPGSPSLSPANTSYVLTADTNIIHARATVRYTITDPIRFHFDFVDAPIFITNALNNALLDVASQFNVDEHSHLAETGLSRGRRLSPPPDHR